MSVQEEPSRNGAAQTGGSQPRRPYHQPKTVDELTTRNIEVVAHLDEAAKAKRTPADCVVDRITAFCGSLTFVWAHVGIYGFWMAGNMLHGIGHFDPYPFPLLSTVVSVEALFLATFILISQNRQNRLAERRNHLDLQINLLSEQENTKILTMVESIVRHLNIPDGDPEISVLAEATEPERLVQQIEKIMEKENNEPDSNDGDEP